MLWLCCDEELDWPVERPMVFEAADETIRMAIDSSDGANTKAAVLATALVALTPAEVLLSAACLAFVCLRDLSASSADL